MQHALRVAAYVTPRVKVCSGKCLIPIKWLAKEESAKLYERALRVPPPDNPLRSAPEDDVHLNSGGQLGLQMKSWREVRLKYFKRSWTGWFTTRTDVDHLSLASALPSTTPGNIII